MNPKRVTLLLLVILLTGCSLAEDVTPPPPLATAQAAPIQQETPMARATVGGDSNVPAVLAPPESSPSTFNGAAIYIDSCEPCHGPNGMGDGSMSANLDVPIPALGDFELAAAAKPIDWYQVVTEGRMQNFMPPFTSLSDAQRWDVVSYALSLSYPPEALLVGAELYTEYCVACHGEAGGGSELGPPLDTSDGFAERSMAGIIDVIQNGQGEMPGVADDRSESDLSFIAAYVQSLGTVGHGAMGQDAAVTEPLAPASETGTISGVVVNGTSNAALPQGLEVSVVGLDGNVPVFEVGQPIDVDGNFIADGLEIVPGRVFGALVEYQGVVYYSIGGHFMEDSPQLELPITIYETTADESDLAVERLHLIFDFSIEGLVEISELWLLSNSGDRTVVQAGGQNTIPITLPEGFSNLRFDTTVEELYTITENGFVIHEPIRPDEPLEVVFSFTLPYSRGLDFIQPLDMPVGAVVLLTEVEAPQIEGRGLQDLGTRDMGGLFLRSYALGAIEAGDQLNLKLQGSHPLAQVDSTSNLVIGLAVFGVVLIGAGFGMWAWQRRSAVDMEPVSEDRPVRSRADLLQAIARLDDAYEAGDLEQGDYEQQRAALKAQVLEHMPKND